MYIRKLFKNTEIFLAGLFRLTNNDNQPFIHNACKNLDFSQQKKFAKYFANIKEFDNILQKFQQETALEIDYQI